MLCALFLVARPVYHSKGDRRASERESSISVSQATVKRWLNEGGLKGRVARRKPKITEVNRRKRLAFAMAHKDKTMDFWQKVVWSDESKLHDALVNRRVWRRQGEAHNPCMTLATTKFPVSVMVWGAFSFSGVGALLPVNGKMDRFQFVELLEEGLLWSAHAMGLGDDFILMQDNDPKHTSRYAREYLESQGITVLEWPPQSPDLNPIEHLWAILKHKLRETGLLDGESMMQAVRRVWESLDKSYLEALVKSMPNRLRAVIKSRGRCTRY